MALKSSVFACLNLALCVSCNNIIIGRSAEPRGKETEKSGSALPPPVRGD